MREIVPTKIAFEPPAAGAPRRGAERGAALVSALLISLLVLGVGGALILSTSMSATTSAEASNEAQAYAAAEAGLQSALNVLRGNSAPNPLPTPSPGTADLNKINFRRAVYRRDPGGATNVPSSNRPDDASEVARLSRWLPYSAAFNDRVELSNPYSPLTGMAYSVTVRDPDRTDQIAYSTSAEWDIPVSLQGTVPGATSPAPGQIVISTPSGVARILYTPAAAVPNTSPLTCYPAITRNLGTFNVTLDAGSTAVTIPAGLRVFLKVRQTFPVDEELTFVGELTGDITLLPPGGSFDLTFKEYSYRTKTAIFTIPQTLRVLDLGAGTTSANTSATITALDPWRLVVTSTGFGPRGARKIVSTVISRVGLDIETPAPLIIRGHDDRTTNATIDIGASNAKDYSGKDNTVKGGKPVRPSIASLAHDRGVVESAYASKPGTVNEPRNGVLDIDAAPPGYPSVPTPWYLRTADQARAFIADAAALADSMGRKFNGFSGNAGSADNPQFTFVNGDCNLDGGAGLLIVTGELVLNGGPYFNGVIIVMGRGRVTKQGGGSGNIYGSMIVASFDLAGTGGFTAPHFDVSGGGGSNLQSDTDSEERARVGTGRRLLGFVEQ